MNDAIPINGEVLKWARESAGLTIDEVVQKMDRRRITYEVIESWEQSFEAPTYSQLERLAYEVYKRPLAVFFFPEPPKEITAKQSFRTLPEYEILRMPAKMRFLLRKAQSFQLNLYDLYDGVNPSEKNITRDLKFPTNISAKEMGETVRQYISINIEKQHSFCNPENAFKEWRKILEGIGLFVFKDAFKSDEFSGFCLYDDKFPVIYVNNSKPFTRQIFTLFHELAHLLFQTDGIDTNIDDFEDFLSNYGKEFNETFDSSLGFYVGIEFYYKKLFLEFNMLFSSSKLNQDLVINDFFLNEGKRSMINSGNITFGYSIYETHRFRILPFIGYGGFGFVETPNDNSDESAFINNATFGINFDLKSNRKTNSKQNFMGYYEQKNSYLRAKIFVSNSIGESSFKGYSINIGLIIGIQGSMSKSIY